MATITTKESLWLISKIFLTIYFSVCLFYLVPIDLSDKSEWFIYFFTLIKKFLLLLLYFIFNFNNLTMFRVLFPTFLAFLPIYFFIPFILTIPGFQLSTFYKFNVLPENHPMHPTKWDEFGSQTFYDILNKIHTTIFELRETKAVFNRHIQSMRFLAKMEPFPIEIQNHKSGYFHHDDNRVTVKNEHYIRLSPDTELYRQLVEGINARYAKLQELYVLQKLEKFPTLPNGIGGPDPGRPDPVINEYRGRLTEDMRIYTELTGKDLTNGPFTQENSILNLVDRDVWQNPVSTEQQIKDNFESKRTIAQAALDARNER